MPECKCECCGKKYAVWFTNNDLWNKHHRTFNFLCPTCFMLNAEYDGCKTTGWFVTVEERAALGAQPATVAAGEPSAAQHGQLAIAARKVVWVRDNDSRLALGWAIDELETALQQQA